MNIDKLIIKNSKDIIWILDNAMKPVVVSPSIFGITGYTVEESLNMGLDEFIDSVSCDKVFDFIETGKSKAHLEQLEDDYSLTFEAVSVRKTGEEIKVELSICPVFDKKNKLEKIIGITRDLTEKKQAEKAVYDIYERFLRMIEIAPVGLVLADQEGRIIYANSSFKKATLYSEDDLRKLRISDLHSEEDSGTCLEEFRDAVSGSAGSYENERKIIKKDGTFLWVSENFSYFERIEERDLVLCSFYDISGKVKLENMILHSDKLQAVGQLAGGISHDLNNMLQVISGYSEMLSEKLSRDDEAMDYTGKIRQAADKSIDMIKHLLLFSRNEHMILSRIELVDVVAEFLKFLKRLIGEKIKLEFFSTGSRNSIIKGNQGQIEQLLMNLCLNARDAIEGNGVIEITIREVDFLEKYSGKFSVIEPGKYICLIVKDNGCGVKKTEMEDIFKPFFTTKKAGEGTGLGLATVLEIVKVHNAKIDFSSLEGIGTRVSVYFPISESGEKSGHDKGNEPMSSFTGNETILIAEDDELVADYTEKILFKYGYNVIRAKNGIDAVEKYISSKGLVDLMIFDIIMPELTGKEAFERIMDLHPEKKGNIRIVFTSGYYSNFMKEKFSTGCPGKILQKPYSEKELLRLIRKMLDK